MSQNPTSSSSLRTRSRGWSSFVRRATTSAPLTTRSKVTGTMTVCSRSTLAAWGVRVRMAVAIARRIPGAADIDPNGESPSAAVSNGSWPSSTSWSSTLSRFRKANNHSQDRLRTAVPSWKLSVIGGASSACIKRPSEFAGKGPSLRGRCKRAAIRPCLKRPIPCGNVIGKY